MRLLAQWNRAGRRGPSLKSADWLVGDDGGLSDREPANCQRGPGAGHLQEPPSRSWAAKTGHRRPFHDGNAIIRLRQISSSGSRTPALFPPPASDSRAIAVLGSPLKIRL